MNRGYSHSKYLILNLVKKAPIKRGKAFIVRKLISLFPVLNKAYFEINGVQITLDLSKSSECTIFLNECMQHELGYEAILEQLTETDTVFYDIGANIGYYSFKLAKSVKQIYSFEPNPYLGNKLRNVIDKNELPNVKIFEIGVSNKEEILDLVFDSLKGNHGCGSFLGEGKNKVSVKTISLDDIIETHTLLTPTILKVDVEGFEINVFKGYKMLNIHKPIVFFEWIDDFVKKQNYSFSILKDFFNEQEWLLYRIENNGFLRAYNLEIAMTSSDMLAVPVGHKQMSLIKKMVEENDNYHFSNI